MCVPYLLSWLNVSCWSLMLSACTLMMGSRLRWYCLEDGILDHANALHELYEWCYCSFLLMPCLYKRQFPCLNDQLPLHSLTPPARSDIPIPKHINILRIYSKISVTEPAPKGRMDSHMESKTLWSSLPKASVLRWLYSLEANCSALSSAQARGGGRAANLEYGLDRTLCRLQWNLCSRWRHWVMVGRDSWWGRLIGHHVSLGVGSVSN